MSSKIFFRYRSRSAGLPPAIVQLKRGGEGEGSASQRQGANVTDAVLHIAVKALAARNCRERGRHSLSARNQKRYNKKSTEEASAAKAKAAATSVISRRYRSRNWFV